MRHRNKTMVGVTRGLCRLTVAMTLSCASDLPPGAAEDNVIPLVVELADYAGAEVKTSPAGAGRILGGHVLVDFQDSLSLASIDSLLAAYNLQRVGFVSGVNIVSARIMDGRSEQEAQSAIESAAEVEFAVLNHILEPDATAGSIPPILDNRGSTPPFALSDSELFVNWPHYVMDTFPAHALADTILGGSGLTDVVLAVIDSGGFQTATATNGSDSSQGSLLSDESGDTDLSPRIVSPTGIVVDTETGVGRLSVGTRDTAFNRLIGTVGTSLHGLEVASAAVGGGQDIVGTGRHVRLRPIRISQTAFEGVCTNDRSIACNSQTPCPEGMGSCDQGVSTLEYLNAALALLADEAADNLKVINLSIGFSIQDQAEREKVQTILSVPFSKLIDAGRLVVVSAGNNVNTSDHAFAVLGPMRGVRRLDPGSTAIQRGMVVAGGTALPKGNLIDVLFQTPNPALDFAGLRESHDSDAAAGDHVRISAPSSFVPLLKGDFTTRRVDGGTSFSAPYVAGLAAEMFAIDPSATNAEIIDIIERTADDLGTVGPDELFGFGRINCWKAILTLLNRSRSSDKPDWLGLRFRFALAADDTLTFSLNGMPVASYAGLRRVPDLPPLMDDNAREVPSGDYLPASVCAQFSIAAADLAGASTGVALLRVASATGSRLYEIPVRLGDLLAARPVDSSMDDYVLTLDIRTPSAAIYGRVTSGTDPVAGATIRYRSTTGDYADTRSDADGYYTIYDAMPDTSFEIAASSEGTIGDAYDIVVGTFETKRQDFVLTGSQFPRTYTGTGARTLSAEWDFLGGGDAVSVQRLDVALTFYEDGTVSANLTTPDGEVVQVPVIGGQPGQTSTQVLNNQSLQTTCPSDADRDPGETVNIVKFTFGQVGWSGTWRDDGTYDLKYQSSFYDMRISGNFSAGSVSGSGSWPDAEQLPRGQPMTNFICSPFESTFYSRIEWEFTAGRLTEEVR